MVNSQKQMTKFCNLFFITLYHLKPCGKCGELKIIDDFYFRNKKNTKLYRICIQCINFYRKNKYDKQKGEINKERRLKRANRTPKQIKIDKEKDKIRWQNTTPEQREKRKQITINWYKNMTPKQKEEERIKNRILCHNRHFNRTPKQIENDEKARIKRKLKDPEIDRFNNPKYLQWALDVKRKDSFTCQGCGETGGPLHSHHIFPFKRFPAFRYLVENGICLCAKCHRNFHRIHGVQKLFVGWMEY